MKLKDYLRSVAETLADAEPGYEFSRYTQQFITETLNDGIAIVAAERPELFTEFDSIQLAPGSLQDARPVFTKLYDVVAQVDAAGNVIRRLDGSRTNATAVKSRWTKPPILVDERAGFCLTSAQIDGTAFGRFSVQPPVPPNEEVYVQVKGVKQPYFTFIDGDDDYEITWPAEVLAALKHYVAAVANRVDGELQAEQLQMTLFTSVLGLTKMADAVAIKQPAAADVKP